MVHLIGILSHLSRAQRQQPELYPFFKFYFQNENHSQFVKTRSQNDFHTNSIQRLLGIKLWEILTLTMTLCTFF